MEMSNFRRRMSEEVRSSKVENAKDVMSSRIENGKHLTIKVDSAEEKRKMSNVAFEPLKTSRISRYLEIFIAETVATMFLMSIGCMSCVEGITKNPITDFHSAITFAFTVSAMICTFGHVSNAHMNPAITIAFYMMGKTTLDEIPVYFLAEMLGATVGVSFLKMVTPEKYFASDMCVTKLGNDVGLVEGVIIEFFITFMLVCMVGGLCDPRNETKQDSAALKFSAVIIAISFGAGKYTGSSMNPARSFGPALVTNYWSAHWIYWVGPISASIVAPMFYKYFQRPPFPNTPGS